MSEIQLYDILNHSFELWEPPPSSVFNGKYALRHRVTDLQY